MNMTVIGRDILDLAELKFDQNGVTISKTVPTLFLTHIDLPEETKLDINLIPVVNIRKVSKVIQTEKM